MNYDWETITRQDEENIFNFLHLFGNVVNECKTDDSKEISIKLQKSSKTIIIENEKLVKNVRR